MAIFDFVKAMNTIAVVEKSSQKGDYNYLKQELGHDAFKQMAVLGLIRGGFYILNGEIVDTYAVTRNYKQWHRIIGLRAMMSKIFPALSL
ncbi:hypothetical protein AGMMS49982_03200 [Bacteroidia bacterium]|nr:hypothetical protein AGMMS49982_03200 [Bacteroidia bacterium]